MQILRKYTLIYYIHKSKTRYFNTNAAKCCKSLTKYYGVILNLIRPIWSANFVDAHKRLAKTKFVDSVETETP